MNLLHPSSIAVIGASSQEGKVGHDILKNLVTQGYTGEVFPINPKGGEILGKTVHASISDLSTIPDLAIIVIPAKLVPDALMECGEKGVKNVIVISAGFSEVHTDEGDKLEQELITISQKYSINLIGPNCLGIVVPGTKMNASFAKELPPAGSIAVISQSGAMGVALMDSAASFGLGLSTFISIGNKAVMDECDTLELLANDPETTVIGFYLESIKDGARFLETAARVARQKPIVLLKAGVSEHGRKAAASHTGALAGSDAAIDALCSETGIHRAHTTEEFMDLLSVLSMEPALLTSNIAIITNAGGPGILATDAAEKAGLNLASLDINIAAKLKEKLPPASSIGNPIDLIGDAGADRYDAAINACQIDPNIDGLLIILTPQVMTPTNDIATLIVKLKKESPLMPIVTAFMGGDSVKEAKKILRAGGIPTFATPERGINALASLRANNHPSSTLGMTKEKRVMVSVDEPDARIEIAQSLISKAKGLLDESTTAKLFALYDLPLPRQDVAHSAEEAIAIAERIGYPVIAKVSSPHILHKTDVGGIQANLQTGPEVAQAFHDIMSNAEKHLKTKNQQLKTALLVQQFLPAGNEFIVGAVRDPSFGPLIMVGLGGIYTELFADTAFRIAPVSQVDAYHMLTELKAWKLLLGLRGKARSDIDALAATIAKVSQLMIDCPQISELDLNPVLVSTDGIVVADAKVVCE